MLDLRLEWLETLRRLIAVHIPDAEVWAYGSRVQGTSHDGSDLDLVVRNPTDLTLPQIGLLDLREALSESELPILVDLLDWAWIPESFRQEIVRGGVVPVQARREVPRSPRI
jgi:predicted nucleotidyltransferase